MDGAQHGKGTWGGTRGAVSGLLERLHRAARPVPRPEVPVQRQSPRLLCKTAGGAGTVHVFGKFLGST